MISFDKKRALMELLPEFFLMTGMDDAAAIKGSGVIEALSAEEVLAAAEMGLGRREIFYAVPNKDDLPATVDKCRIVANSMEELIAINDAAKPFAVDGSLIMVGLRMVADGFTDSTSLGITTKQLQGMVHDIKQLKNISVCGCIVVGDVDGLHGKELGKYVRASYQTAKQMTYILPCSMPYICVAGCLEAAARNEAEHPEDFEEFLTAANIVGMQNSTAFYADYYIQ